MMLPVRKRERATIPRSWLASALAIAMAMHGFSAARALSCVGSTIALFPPSGDLPANPVFVLQGSGAAGEAIRALAEGDVVLRGKDADIPIRFLERSSKYLDHLLIAPAEGPLPEGPVDLSLRRKVGSSGPEWTVYGKWTVVGGVDRTSPEVIQGDTKPEIKVQDSGWGESVSVTFPVAVSESPAALLASVAESEDGAPVGDRVELFLLHKGSSLYRGPCGRNHLLEKGKQYLVDLIPIDSAGNRGRATEQYFVVEVP